MAKLSENPSRGLERRRLARRRDAHRLQHLDGAARRVLLDEAGALDQKTKGAALPSITGTSGPSSSTTALSISSPANAAIRCSTVATDDAFGGRGSCTASRRRGCASLPPSRRRRRCGGSGCRYRSPPDERHADPRAGMKPDAAAPDRRLQRLLPWRDPSHPSASSLPAVEVIVGHRINSAMLLCTNHSLFQIISQKTELFQCLDGRQPGARRAACRCDRPGRARGRQRVSSPGGAGRPECPAGPPRGCAAAMRSAGSRRAEPRRLRRPPGRRAGPRAARRASSGGRPW